MKIFLLSDNRDTLVGMRIAGINGVVTNDPKEAEKLLDELVKDKETGIILITEKLAMLVGGKVNMIKQKMVCPLIVEIPDRHGSRRQADYITGYVRESIGIKI